MTSIARIPDTSKKRVVIVGVGFAGLRLARSLSSRNFQVILIDKNNYHQFQPLLYQVATSGLEPAAIAFPLRKIFQNKKHIHFRVAKFLAVDQDMNCILTSIGSIQYDYLVLATGVKPNYFGNRNIEKYALSMKAVADAIYIRNIILENFEKALSADTEEEIALMNIVIVGGGPTGVELAGAIAEMRKFILPKDYPELDFNKMEIYLMEGANRLLGDMSLKASERSKLFLENMGVKVRLKTIVKEYDGNIVLLDDGTSVRSEILLWAAGIKACEVKGLASDTYGKGGRIVVDEINKVQGTTNIFAIGDIAIMISEKYPAGHPQVAQPAIQQGLQLSKNLKRLQRSRPLIPFRYAEKGSLATVGRNRAVADLPFGSFSGFWAWILWLFVHLMSLVGKKNRLFVFINWSLSYFTYDQSFRLMIKPKTRESP